METEMGTKPMEMEKKAVAMEFITIQTGGHKMTHLCMLCKDQNQDKRSSHTWSEVLTGTAAFPEVGLDS